MKHSPGERGKPPVQPRPEVPPVQRRGAPPITEAQTDDEALELRDILGPAASAPEIPRETMVRFGSLKSAPRRVFIMSYNQPVQIRGKEIADGAFITVDEVPEGDVFFSDRPLGNAVEMTATGGKPMLWRRIGIAPDPDNRSKSLEKYARVEEGALHSVRTWWENIQTRLYFKSKARRNR